jgi:hypothetical protein
MTGVAVSNRYSSSASDTVREHARDVYLRPAQQRGVKTVVINVGKVHRALALENRIPLVCQALKSAKFLETNGLRVISQTGPPSGQSTTVTYTYQFIDADESVLPKSDPWKELRGVLKDVFAELGGGENYLRRERESFEPRKGSR